jgi:hypothetical protein
MLISFSTTVSGVRFHIFFALNDAIHRLRRKDDWAVDGDSILRCLSSVITGMRGLGKEFCCVSGLVSSSISQNQNK